MRLRRLATVLAGVCLMVGCSSSDGAKDVGSEVPDSRGESEVALADVHAETAAPVDAEVPDAEPEVTDVTVEEVWPADVTIPVPTDEPEAGIRMVLSAQPSVPFPWNGFLVPDATSRTGRRVSFQGPLAIPDVLQGVADMFPKAVADLGAMGGFGALGMVAVPLITDVDVGTLPVATDETDQISVFEVSANGLVERPFQIEFQDCSEDAELRLLMLLPRVPLKEKTRFLVVFRTGLMDSAGVPFAPGPVAEVLLGLRNPFGTPAQQQMLVAQREETLAALAAGGDGLAVDDIAAAWVFDTDVMESDLFDAAAVIDDEEATFDFDPDGDGNPNVFQPGENGAPSGDGMAGFVQGRFRVPNFRNEEGIMVYGDDGKPAVQGYEWRDFWLMLPEGILEGEVPIAFVQHGLNSWKETMYGMGKEFVARGFVAAGFDFLHHGKGVDGGWDFVIIEKLLVTRDNFRQCALDYYAFIKAFQALSEGVVMPLLPMPVSEGGIDFARIVITGHSLGAIESALAAPLYRGDALVGLLNAGANLQYLMMGFLKETGLYDLAPCDMLHGLRVAASHVMSPMDPGIVARYMYQEPHPDVPAKPYLLEIGLHDGTVYPETGYDLARALGSPLLDPCLDCWPYLDVVPAESTSVGTVQFDGDHEFFFGGDGPEIKAAARAIYFHFIETGLAEGLPELLWPVPEDQS